MGKPVNLNRFRKTKARAEKKARADANCALHGVPKSARDAAKAVQTKADRLHFGNKLLNDPKD